MRIYLKSVNMRPPLYKFDWITLATCNVWKICSQAKVRGWAQQIVCYTFFYIPRFNFCIEYVKNQISNGDLGGIASPLLSWWPYREENVLIQYTFMSTKPHLMAVNGDRDCVTVVCWLGLHLEVQHTYNSEENGNGFKDQNKAPVLCLGSQIWCSDCMNIDWSELVHFAFLDKVFWHYPSFQVVLGNTCTSLHVGLMHQFIHTR